MAVSSNLDEVIAKLLALYRDIHILNVTDTLIGGVNAAAGEMRYRIFNTGTDADGVAFGKYSGRKSKLTSRKFTYLNHQDDASFQNDQPYFKKKQKKIHKNAEATGEESFSEYEKLRLSEGRQIAYKDLEFYGSLRRSIVVLSDGANSVVCSIVDDKELQIANYQEEQIGKIHGTDKVRIFALNDTETQTMETNIQELLKQVYDRLLNIA